MNPASPEASPPQHQTMSHPASLFSDWRVAILVLTALWLVIYIVGLSTPALLDDADSIHGEAAREMVLRHDWVTLYSNGICYLEKAPLLYWTVASSYTLFGVSEWSTRLPLMLGVLATILATCGLGRWTFGGEGGLLAGVVMVTSIGPYIFTRFLLPDVLIGLWLAIGYYFFLRSLEVATPSRWTCWGFAAACALNVLTKGIAARICQGAAIARKTRVLETMRSVRDSRVVRHSVERSHSGVPVDRPETIPRSCAG